MQMYFLSQIIKKSIHLHTPQWKNHPIGCPDLNFYTSICKVDLYQDIDLHCSIFFIKNVW